ncbi:MAG: D-2-hydroxyacid dehydrogenase [Alphaproteobacteria bacterium]
MAAGNRKAKLKVFFDGAYNRPTVFQTTPERYAEAAKRHKALAKRIDVTIGESFDEMAPMIGAVDIAMGFRFPKEMIRTGARSLKWIHNTGAGVEHLMPLEWLPERAILTNNRGIHRDKTGESALMAVLMLNNRMPELLASQRARRWEPLFTPPIAGRTLLIVGVGNMGGAAARVAKKMGMKVLGVRRSGGTHPAVDEMAKPVKLLKLLPRADFVLVTLPVTPATRHMLGARELDAMKPGAGLVNFGRAAVVDYEALRVRLESGRIGGAVLDVFNPEPLPSESPLWGTRNLIVTPHCTSDDLEAYIPKTLDLFFENLDRLLSGKKLKNVVDRKLWY